MGGGGGWEAGGGLHCVLQLCGSKRFVFISLHNVAICDMKFCMIYSFQSIIYLYVVSCMYFLLY